MAQATPRGGVALADALTLECEDYLIYEVGRKRSTVDQYLARWGYLENRTGKPMPEIDCSDIRGLKRAVIDGSLPWSRNYFNGILSSWKVFREWGAIDGRWELNGDKGIPSLPVDDEEDSPPLPPEKVRALLDACRRPLEFRLIYYPAFAGTRIGESASISGAMWQDGWLRFRSEKSSRMHEVPIHPELEAVKWDLFASQPTHDSTLQRVCRRMRNRVGFYFKTHQIRKSFGTRLQDARVSDLCIEDLLGHSLGLRGVYRRVSPLEKQEAIAVVNY